MNINYNILKKYNFKDSLGHPLENCTEFRELVDLALKAKVLEELVEDSEFYYEDVDDYYSNGFHV